MTTVNAITLSQAEVMIVDAAWLARLLELDWPAMRRERGAVLRDVGPDRGVARGFSRQLAGTQVASVQQDALVSGAGARPYPRSGARHHGERDEQQPAALTRDGWSR